MGSAATCAHTVLQKKRLLTTTGTPLMGRRYKCQWLCVIIKEHFKLFSILLGFNTLKSIPASQLSPKMTPLQSTYVMKFQNMLHFQQHFLSMHVRCPHCCRSHSGIPILETMQWTIRSDLDYGHWLLFQPQLQQLELEPLEQLCLST